MNVTSLSQKISFLELAFHKIHSAYSASQQNKQRNFFPVHLAMKITLCVAKQKTYCRKIGALETKGDQERETKGEKDNHTFA